METLTHKRLSEKIKELPEFLAIELSDFIDFLMLKKDKDWSETLTAEQKNSIKEGLKDIENKKIFDHDSVMEEMAEYRRNRRS